MNIGASHPRIYLVNSCYGKWSQTLAWSAIFLVNRLTLTCTTEVFVSKFSKVKFSADHSPNMKSNCSSLNTWRAVHGNSKGCLQSCSIIPNFFFPDSQLAKKTILTLCFYYWSNTYRHSRESSALLHCCVVKKIAARVWWPAWRALKLLHSVVPTDILEVSIIKWIDKYIYTIINNDKKQVQQKLNISTNLKLWIQFWAGNVYKLKVKIYFTY